MYPVPRHSAPSAARRPTPPHTQPRAAALSGISRVRPAESIPRRLPGYGLIGSCLDSFYDHGRINPYRQQSPCPDYPVNPLGYASQQGCLELSGLQLITLGDDPINAVRYATGSVFLTTAKAEIVSPSGRTALIERIILPAAGSAIHAGMARSASFVGDILVGDSNPAIAIALEQLLQHPDLVADNIEAIFGQIRILCLGHHVELDENMCRSRGTMVQFRAALGDIKRYLGSPPLHQRGLFPGPVRATAAAFVWLTLEARKTYRGRVWREPMFDSTGRLICPTTNAFAPPCGELETPPVMRRQMNIVRIREVLEQIRSLFTRSSTRQDAPRLKTDVADRDPMVLLQEARRGDLVVLDDRFHNYAWSDSTDYFPHFAELIRTPWKAGARILSVCSNMYPGAREKLRQQGLHTHWQAGKSNLGSLNPADRIEATAKDGYVLAMNFDPSTRGHELLPLPPT